MRTREQPVPAVEATAPSPTMLDIRNIAKSFGKNVVLRGISLQVAEGEFLTILGESGSGKTTLLRIIAGFESATSGELWMSGERLDRLPPRQPGGDHTLYHYTVFSPPHVRESGA